MIYDSKKCKEVGGKDDPWATKFIANDSAGFGPYRVKQLVRGQQAVFTARDDYYKGKPYIEEVVFKEVPTSATRMSLLQGGAVDIALFLQPLEYIQLKKVKSVSVDTVAATYMLWIEQNAKFKPFDNVKVRKAMNYAFPREEVLKTVYQNLSDKLDGCIPDIYPGFTDKFWQYDTDLAKAKQLLIEAGLGSGFKTTLAYNAGEPVHEPISIMYQTNLRQMGVELTLKKLPAATFYDHVTKRLEPMIYYSDSPWVPDPGYSTNLYFHSKSYVNYGNYHNPEVTRLITEGLETIDPPKRKVIYDRVQEVIMDEAPWVFISFPNYTLAHLSDLKGFTYYVSNNLRFQDFHREG
jgi:peptide/nickel transport system substrate-binding protein